MKGSKFQMTVFQHALNPIICIGMSDGRFTADELEYLKTSTACLAEWFQITTDQAMKECEELYNHISDELSNRDIRFIYLNVPVSCAIAHKNLKSDAGRNYLIRLLEDQANSDGELTSDEVQLVNMYSTIILHGGESAGIHV